MKYSLAFALFLCLVSACKKKSKNADDTAYSASFHYYGGYYSAVQADYREKKYTLVNPKWGQPSEPFYVDVDGFELNLWSHPAGKAILLSFQINGRNVGKYALGKLKPNGFLLNMYENGTVFKRSAEGGGDSSWVELTKVDLSNKLISGKFFCYDKSLVSGGSDYYATTSGEFKNVKLQ